MMRTATKRTWIATIVFFGSASIAASDWREFRGPNRSGISPAKDIPTLWSATTNLRWKTLLPGPGTSSPVLFRDRIYVTCYSGYGLDPKGAGNPNQLKRHLVCISRNDGKILWDSVMQLKAPEHSYGGFLALHGYASSTPTVDDGAVYVYYGASGAAAYSHAGELQWNTSCGIRVLDSWGSASSPILYKDLLIVHADVESESIYALNRKTGLEVWKRTFPSDKQHARSTPLLLSRPEGDELVIHSRMTWLTSLNPADGKTRWEYQGTGTYQHPSPITDGNLIYALAHQKSVAVTPGGKQVWQINKGSEICTPIHYEGHLYWANEEGIAYCVDAKSGKLVFAQRLEPEPGRVYASGVLTEGRIYYVSRQSGTYIVAATPQYRLLAHNRIDGDDTVFNATPAIENGRIYLRSNKYLYGIGN